MDSRVKHGGYRQLGRLDWRSREARFVAEVEAELATALGGEPTVQECLLDTESSREVDAAHAHGIRVAQERFRRSGGSGQRLPEMVPRTALFGGLSLPICPASRAYFHRSS